MNLFLTRPEPQASSSLNRLVHLGHSVINEPCQHVSAIEAVLQPADAYIVSSLNGVKYGLSKVADKRAVIFAVGERTAIAAEELGFEEIYAADGDTESLLEMITYRWSPGDGALLHLAGAEIVSDVAALLSTIGYSARQQVIYEALAISQPEQSSLDAIKNEEIDAVLFYSARAVTIFMEWIENAALDKSLKKIEAVALSERVAECLGTDWKCVKVASERNEEALIKALSGEK